MGAAAGCAAAAVSYPVYWEPRWVEVTRTRVRVAGLRSTVRVLHAADLHASMFVPLPYIADAIAQGVAEKPDLICVTGDFVHHRGEWHEAEYVRVLRRLSECAPTFAVMGNHDGGVWAREHHGDADHKKVDRLLELAGIELLHNRGRRVIVRDQELNLAGVGDLWAREIEAERAFAELDERRPTVLLSHNPDSKGEFRRFHWDLMLSGHTHGGQIVLPFAGPKYAPVVDKRFVAGLGAWEGRQIYVTRGVGSLYGVRFRCRPEVTVLELGES